MADKLITADDVIRAGGCIEGVYERMREVAENHRLAAAMAPKAIRAMLLEDEHKIINEAASLDYCARIDSIYGWSDGCIGPGHGFAAPNGTGHGSGDGEGYGGGDMKGGGNSIGAGYGHANGGHRTGISTGGGNGEPFGQGASNDYGYNEWDDEE